MFRGPSERGVVCRLSGSNQTKWKIHSPAERRASPSHRSKLCRIRAEAKREPSDFFFFFPLSCFAGGLCGTSFSAAASFHSHKGEPRPARTKRELGDISLWSSEKHQKDGSDTLFSDDMVDFQLFFFPLSGFWSHALASRAGMPHRTLLTPRSDQTRRASEVCE